MTPLTPWDGGVDGLLPGARQEILIELLACVDVARDHQIRLTKAGMPPKPLWSLVNERLLWADPRSVLYDWDEVDQVRFVYSLAEGLKLIEPDEERLLRPGSGTDTFYFADPVRRTVLLLRAYQFVVDWDERCDARNNQGSRFFFGQTFRRDFVVPIHHVRSVLLTHLGRAQVDTWHHAETLARAVTLAEPTLLISGDDPVPEAPAGESDGEIRRLVDYWLLVMARFGLIDLARTPDRPDGTLGERLFRLTAMGARVLHRTPPLDPPAPPGGTPFVLQPNNDVILYRDDADVSDEYLLRRITSELKTVDYDEKTVTYPVTPQSLRAAIADGLDPETIESRLFARSSSGVPDGFRTMLDDAARAPLPARIIRGLSALEVAPGDDATLERLRDRGLEVFDRLVLVPWGRWPDVIEVLGEVENGYEYPTLEDLVLWEDATIELAFQAQPLAARDLIDTLGLDAETTVLLDDARLQRLSAEGWPIESVRDALVSLVASPDALPRHLQPRS